MSDVTSVSGVPVWARAAALQSGRPVVIVVHGMSFAPETLRREWPEAEDGLERVYWRLPVLREGREAVAARHARDPFREVYAPVVAESREELGRLVAAFADRPVGLFGFSIGGLIALWGAADQPAVRAAVSVGGVPSLEYLAAFYPDYDWRQPDVVRERRRHDLSANLALLAGKATLILHGEEDEIIPWPLMAETARRLAESEPEMHPFALYPCVGHRLSGEGAAEEAELSRLKAQATAFLRAALIAAADERGRP
jgi:pimeloyl-ACP methyl ester carboxylesterase